MPEENNDLEIKPVTDGENQALPVTSQTENKQAAPQEAPQEPTVDPHKSFDLDNLKTNIEEEINQIEQPNPAPAESSTNISEPTVTVSTTKESSFKKIIVIGIIIILLLTGLYFAYQFNFGSNNSDQNAIKETPKDMEELEEVVNTLKEQVEDESTDEDTIQEELETDETVEESNKEEEVVEVEEEAEPDEIPKELEDLLDEAKNNEQSDSPPGLSISFPSANEEIEEETLIEEVIKEEPSEKSTVEEKIMR